MLARISAALLALILAGMMPLHGQDQSPSVDAAAPIATDRPAITNSSLVVPAGSFQVENGFLKTSSQGQSVLVTDPHNASLEEGLRRTPLLVITFINSVHSESQAKYEAKEWVPLPLNLKSW